MNKRWLPFSVQNKRTGLLALIICSSFFAVGIIAGFFTTGLLPDSSVKLIEGHISGYVSAINEGVFTNPGYWSVCKSTLLPAFLAFFMGLSIVGFALVPLIGAVKGFLLGFSVSAVIKVLGSAGWPFAFGIFGLSSIVQIPCFVAVSVSACMSSYGLLSNVSQSRGKLQHSELNKGYFLRCALYFVILFAVSLAELFIFPRVAALLTRV